MIQLDAASRHLLDLPDEVIQCIVSHVDPEETLRLSRTCRRLANITSEPLLWKSLCQRSFKWWDERHHYASRLKDPSFTQWKALFCDRHRSTHVARRALAEIVGDEIGRLDRFSEILDAGYDAKDELMDAYRSASSSPDHLAQRYWSHTALGCVHRLRALQEWNLLRSRSDIENATERSLGALDMFILGEQDQGDLADIFDRLNSYAAAIRAANPDIDEQPVRQRAATIADHLLRNHWIGIHDGRDYHSLDHMFLGVSLFSDNRNSVPLISAVTFCYVARQFDLQAAPVSFPFHVHALIRARVGYDLDDNLLTSPMPAGLDERTHLFMDPFQSNTPIPITSLQRQLRFVAPGASAAQTAGYTTSASARELTIRAAHNILSAPNHYTGSPLHPIPSSAATYAALFSLVLFPSEGAHPAQLRQHLAVLVQHFLEYFEQDVHLFETYILPLAAHLPDVASYAIYIHNLRETDLAPKTPKRHSQAENEVVKYRIGQVFRHRRRGYLAVVYGWDPVCKMQEQWITMNQVDRLPGGRGQPFYNVLVEDESMRYVAEENVVLLLPSEITEEMIERFPIEIGKWFKRFDMDSGVFVSNVRAEYPED